MPHTVFRKILSVVTAIMISLTLGCSRQESDQDPTVGIIPAKLNPVERERFRRLPLQGAHNFRDLGGYKTLDGQAVKWGVLYRSDSLDELTDDDLSYLRRLKLQHIIDFRTPEERDAAPDRTPEGVTVERLPITVAGTALIPLREKLLSGNIKAGSFAQLLTDANSSFVSNNSAAFRQYIHRLTDSDNLPLLFHCTAGKDRTGFAAAIVLLAIGIPEEAVIHDYMLSNRYTEGEINKQVLTIRVASLLRTSDEQVRPLLSVQQSYLESALNRMKSQYGSIDNYLVEALGITPTVRKKLRKNLLNPLVLKLLPRPQPTAQSAMVVD